MIHAALELECGSVNKAAARLSISHSNLRKIISADNGLRSRWMLKNEAGTGAPGEESTIHRELVTPETIAVGGKELELDEAKKIARAMDEEDAAVRESMMSLGIRGEGLEMVLAMQKVQRKHFARCIEIVGGGITKQSIDIMMEIAKINAKLESTTNPPTFEEQRMLREDRRGLLDILGRYKDKVDKSALIQAMVKKVEAEIKNGKKGGNSRPGFGVLVKGEKVEIHEHTSSE